MPTHLIPSRELAPDALLPGDPGRALLLAQELLEKPLMSNHNRGLWGYTGETADGLPLTIQSTGMGAPSAAIVLHELADLGVRRAIRVGTCGALDGSLELGQLLRVEEALADDGVTRTLGEQEVVAPDPGLLGRLESLEAGNPARVVSSDLFYRYGDAPQEAWASEGFAAVEMESAALFAVGRRLEVEVASLLVVSDVFPEGRRVRIEAEALAVAAARMGRAAAAALAPSD